MDEESESQYWNQLENQYKSKILSNKQSLNIKDSSKLDFKNNNLNNLNEPIKINSQQSNNVDLIKTNQINNNKNPSENKKTKMQRIDTNKWLKNLTNLNFDPKEMMFVQSKKNRTDSYILVRHSKLGRVWHQFGPKKDIVETNLQILTELQDKQHKQLEIDEKILFEKSMELKQKQKEFK